MPTNELSFEGLQKLLWGFAPHRVITVAARTGVLRRLAAAPATTDEVATDLELDPLAAGKVIRALTALGLVAADGDTYRVVGELGRCFQEGQGDLAPFLEHSHHLYDSWGANLERWLRGERWPTGGRDREGMRQFSEAMRAMGSHTADQVAAHIDLAGVRRMLDVGGSFGHFARKLCESAPDLTATVLDVPEVVSLAREAEDDAGLASGLEFVAGDYRADDYGSGYDLVLLSNVLHQEKPDVAAEMVRRAARALLPGGRVVVVDFSIDDAQRENLVGALFAINMRSFGDTHTEAAIRGWMERAGLDDIQRTDLTDHRWLIIGRHPYQGMAQTF